VYELQVKWSCTTLYDAWMMVVHKKPILRSGCAELPRKTKWSTSHLTNMRWRRSDVVLLSPNIGSLHGSILHMYTCCTLFNIWLWFYVCHAPDLRCTFHVLDCRLKFSMWKTLDKYLAPVFNQSILYQAKGCSAVQLESQQQYVGRGLVYHAQYASFGSLPAHSLGNGDEILHTDTWQSVTLTLICIFYVTEALFSRITSGDAESPKSERFGICREILANQMPSLLPDHCHQSTEGTFLYVRYRYIGKFNKFKCLVISQLDVKLAATNCICCA